MPLPTHLSAGAEVTTDVVIVGSGIAGLVTALDLLDMRADLSVVLVDKGLSGSSGSTPLAQGGLAAAVGPDDSPELHALDTLVAGDGHADPRAVGVMAAETPARVRDLIARGAVFDTQASGALALAREGGQRVSRSVRAADASGAEIYRALRASAVGRADGGRLIRVQGMAVALATGPFPEHRVQGIWVAVDDIEGGVATPSQAGGLSLVRAHAVMLATGGCGGLYAGTTNRDEATGDSIAMATGVGAAVQDLEFIQFHPTGLKAADGRFQRFLMTEALRGAGAHLLGADGRRFMLDRHPDAELAPRHVVAKAILDQPDGAWLDATMIPDAQLREEFPTVLEGAHAYGYDLRAEPVPVEPCEHYMIGGVATDLHARTSVPGLYAAGEVASSGVHGANRMAGNSLAQSCVFGHRAARDMAQAIPEDGRAPDVTSPQPTFGEPADVDLGAVRADIRRAMSAGAGAIRDEAGLKQTLAVVEHTAAMLSSAWGPQGPPRDQASQEVANMLTAGHAIVTSALLRPESRGSHFRLDHPDADPAWAGRRQRLHATDLAIGSLPS